MTLRRWVYRGLGWMSGPVLAMPWSRRWMRVLAYHAADDVEKFEEQIAYLAPRVDFVSTPDQSRMSLRPRVWITFDDGDPSVVANALPVLERYSAKATLFVCPSVIDTKAPFWWQTVDKARSLGVKIEGTALASVAELKVMPDRLRRSIVSQAEAGIAMIAGQKLSCTQLTTEQVHKWTAAGNEVGNHTWDHPMLDMCDPGTQRRQIDKAHEWLRDVAKPRNLYFAYPNGNRTDVAAGHLRSLGYEAACLFDHRLHVSSQSFEVSRVRVNASDDLAEFKTRVSGIHPVIHRRLMRR